MVDLLETTHMPKHESPRIGRRGLLKTSAALLGGAVLGARAKAAPDPPFQNVNTHSSPVVGRGALLA